MINILWVVEMLIDGWWKPTCGVGFTRAEIRDEIKVWKENLPNDKFRIRKFYQKG